MNHCVLKNINIHLIWMTSTGMALQRLLHKFNITTKRGHRFHTKVIRATIIINYWMRLSRIWRILQVEENVIHRGLRRKWITPSEICRILHILRKPNSIIALLFIQNIIFAQTCGHFSLCCMTQPCAQVFSVNGSIIIGVNDSIICSGLHFWRHFDVNGSIICNGLHFWRHWFNMTEFLFNSSCLCVWF